MTSAAAIAAEFGIPASRAQYVARKLFGKRLAGNRSMLTSEAADELRAALRARIERPPDAPMSLREAIQRSGWTRRALLLALAELGVAAPARVSQYQITREQLEAACRLLEQRYTTRTLGARYGLSGVTATRIARKVLGPRPKAYYLTEEQVAALRPAFEVARSRRTRRSQKEAWL